MAAHDDPRFPSKGPEEGDSSSHSSEPPNPSAESPQPGTDQPDPGESHYDLADRIIVGAPQQLPGTPEMPISISVESAAPPPPPDAHLPEDLRISWGWGHLALFLIFAVAVFVITQLGAGLYLASIAESPHLTQKDFEHLAVNHPVVPIVANVTLYALVILFLYVTVGVLKNLPFWRSFGWRRLLPVPHAPSNPWIYVVGGVGLSICVALVSSTLKTPKDLPIEEMFKSRPGAFLLMGMAVLLAPLVEETVFRGYLYPLFAKHIGASAGIVLTGVLFGLMHAPQLGWTWSLVAMLITVGIIFTLARARTGTTLASYLMHLAYNSTIAVSAIIATHGFTRMPPH